MYRYFVFSGDNYYPGGGWHDFCIATNSLELAKSTADYERVAGGMDWAHVVDSETREIVYRSVSK